jgi:hypothetical protein
MIKHASVLLASLVVASLGYTSVPKQISLPSAAASCRHTGNANQTDRDRAEQAVAFAKAINGAEAESKKRSGAYRSIASLGNLPTVPTEFKVSLYADQTGYMFSLKDTLDPCHFAVFSDTAGLLYQQSALTAPVIAQ